MDTPIDELVARLGGFVLTDKASAYQAFRDGKIIITEDEKELEAFANHHGSEGDQIERGANGSFRYFQAMGNIFYFTYHKDKVLKDSVKRLKEFEP